MADMPINQEDLSASQWHEADDLTCAICLSAPSPVDIAIVKGCEHTYCVNCILHWAHYKEIPLCPQCKTPFNYLYVHRLLDGTIMDYAVEESICLLKRAKWFTDHMEVLDKGRVIGAFSGIGQEDLDYYDEEDDDDDDLESYYFGNAGGHRVLLGNRRFGENGFVRGGRRFARPLPVQPQAQASTSATAKKKVTLTGKANAATSGSTGGAVFSFSRDLGGGSLTPTTSFTPSSLLSNENELNQCRGGIASLSLSQEHPCEGLGALCKKEEDMIEAMGNEEGMGMMGGKGNVHLRVTKGPSQQPAGSSNNDGVPGPSSPSSVSAGANGGKDSRKQGRRAQRSARRAAMDYEEAYLDEF